MYEFIIKIMNLILIGDWGLGIGDWGLGIWPNPQNPKPKTHTPKNKILL
jgi:hypothetical protein